MKRRCQAWGCVMLATHRRRLGWRTIWFCCRHYSARYPAPKLICCCRTRVVDVIVDKHRYV